MTVFTSLAYPNVRLLSSYISLFITESSLMERLHYIILDLALKGALAPQLLMQYYSLLNPSRLYIVLNIAPPCSGSYQYPQYPPRCDNILFGEDGIQTHYLVSAVVAPTPNDPRRGTKNRELDARFDTRPPQHCFQSFPPGDRTKSIRSRIKYPGRYLRSDSSSISTAGSVTCSCMDHGLLVASARKTKSDQRWRISQYRAHSFNARDADTSPSRRAELNRHCQSSRHPSA
ncbi:hypothetical protein HCBG_00379 [Histoplasma capsulatum G186AR]|uniref:Uncharacterized protein n=1 Tax=Ajellomyces capsulatus (strain G186AR / H82 / ATCC MYA-2454 / RMSCC 2432) TaxID=447093 RepID=C0NB83_AJECG|nr:uncharacterized protein HCBG_00379 [Histoplasma capsulatum G186AR]EEH10924.1 hypothetical protein HCBG_00379 [Histoplasma capsulatum G186AR]